MSRTESKRRAKVSLAAAGLLAATLAGLLGTPCSRATTPSDSSHALEAITPVATLDWTHLKLAAIGVAVRTGLSDREGQMRAAQLDADFQVRSALRKLRIIGGLRGGDLFESSRDANQVLAELASDYEVMGDSLFEQDGTLEAMVLLPLLGEKHLVDVLLDSLLPAKGELPLDSSRYTGVVIDVRRFGFKPSLFPRLLNHQGDTLHQPAEGVPESLVKHGYAHFVRREGEFSRVWAGSRPLRLRADGAVGEIRTDVLLPAGGKERQLLLAREAGLLAHGRLVLIVD